MMASVWVWFYSVSSKQSLLLCFNLQLTVITGYLTWSVIRWSVLNRAWWLSVWWPCNKSEQRPTTSLLSKKIVSTWSSGSLAASAALLDILELVVAYRRWAWWTRWIFFWGEYFTLLEHILGSSYDGLVICKMIITPLWRKQLLLSLWLVKGAMAH